MMTVITEVALKQGAEAEWDQAMRDRLNAATGQPGCVLGQLLTPVDGAKRRVIVGTWTTQDEWEAWHDDPAFKETRERLEGLQEKPSEMQWFEVVEAGGEATA
jgi:heme-degrading monooxygenase HmoA